MGDEEALDTTGEIVVSEDDKTKETTDENEIVLDGEGSQPENRGIRRRINKLNARNEASKEGESTAKAELATEKQRSELLQLALDQKETRPPNPGDFEDGVADAKFVEASDAHIQSLVDKRVQKAVAKIPTSEPVNHDLRRKQERHYKDADGLRIKDFEETEDQAIEILGQATVNEIINVSEKSHIITYYFGKNLRQAEAFADLVKSAPVEAAKEIGRLEERLKVKPLTQTEQAEPDEELEGGSADTDSAYQRQLDKLREQATTGDSSVMGKILALKKQHREKAA